MENDAYILSCGTTDGVFWALNEIHTTTAMLRKIFPDNRMYITSKNQLVITRVKMQDDERFFRLVPL